jgi:predicted signal transduction protein with EAL and GGDEF domain
VVEGTETEEQIAWLAALGHIEAQGFLFSRPVPVDAIPALLERFGVCGMAERRGAREPAADSATSSSGQSA